MSTFAFARATLRSLAARLELEIVGPEDVVREANSLVNRGANGTALTTLATQQPPVRRDDVAALLNESLLQMGDAPIDGPQAGRIVALEIAQAIVAGEIAPVDGAREIWWKVVSRVPQLEPEFGNFVGLASEWEDSTNHRREYEEDIREAARLVVGGADD